MISQIVLCKQITPDFYEEELCSIQKDSEEIRGLINELQEFMPQSSGDIGTVIFLSSIFPFPIPLRILFLNDVLYILTRFSQNDRIYIESSCHLE